MVNKTFSISGDVATLLNFEHNQSGLICSLLRDYYAGIGPEKAKKERLLSLKNEQKLVKLSIKMGKKEQEKQAELEQMKERAGGNGITELQIKAWEKKWA